MYSCLLDSFEFNTLCTTEITDLSSYIDSSYSGSGSSNPYYFSIVIVEL
jgi:hypothetical protein